MEKLLNTIELVTVPSILITEVVQLRIKNVGGLTKAKRQVKVMGMVRKRECLVEPGFTKWGRKGSSRTLQKILTAKEFSLCKHL